MDASKFESLLTEAANQLTAESCQTDRFPNSKVFEDRVREVLQTLLAKSGIHLDLSAAAQTFPDISINSIGVEVKFTTSDSWRCVANSVFEGTRNASIRQIYVMYGKMGGVPAVRWRKYGDCVMHVRTSHVPRFEVDIEAKESLFTLMGTTYDDFSAKSDDEKMTYVRTYARGRLKEGERLWWLDDSADQPKHTLSVNVQLYMRLSNEEKRQLRAEAALLCPQIFKGSRQRDKYNDAALYLITYRGVFCPQARDLFTAGSVALRANEKRGGSYLLRGIQDICDEIVQAANSLEDALFREYWGQVVAKEERIEEWLRRIDDFAAGSASPSDSLRNRLLRSQAKLTQ